MVIFDVKDMARGLLTLPNEHLVLREKVAAHLITVASEIFNHPHREMSLVDDLIDHYEFEQGVFGLDVVVMETVAKMKQAAQRAGWDRRMKGKVEFKEVGRGFYQARFVMDLDETMAWMFHKEESSEPDVNVTDIVSDNPGADLINELNKLHTRETRRRVPALSDRLATTVREPEEPGWRVSYWDRAGRRSLRSTGPGSSGQGD